MKHFTGEEAILILSSAVGRHLVQGNLVSKTNLVSWFLRVLIHSFNTP
jgi:hypothetical protein